MSVDLEYAAAHDRALLIERPARAFLGLTGADRAAFLQGLLTNDIVALQPGAWCYACYLTPQGRIIADMNVVAREDSILLDTRLDVKDVVLARFNDFIFADDVQVNDVTGDLDSLAVAGPESASVRPSGEVVIDSMDYGFPGWIIYAPPAAIQTLRDELARERVATGSPELAEVLRVHAGRPEFHVDMDEDTIPLEAGIEDRALSFTKGCYVGQEVIVRVLHRGHGRIAKKLVGLVVDAANEGLSVSSGDRIHADDKDVGVITSAVWSPALKRPVALGYVHRDHNTPGTRVAVETKAGRVPAEVTALPIVPPDAR